MARIAFFTLYNTVASGVRILSAILRREGHEVCNFLLKTPSNMAHLSPDLVADDPLLDGIYSQTMNSTGLYLNNYAVKPVTPRERTLLLEAVAGFKPDVVGLSATSFLGHLGMELVAGLREHCPGAMFVAGGYGPTFSPATFLEAYDCVLVGEGETALPELVRRLQDGRDWREIPNLAYLDGGTVRRNEFCALVTDLDTLPFADYRTGSFALIEDDKLEWRDPLGSYYLSAGRGCPGRCTYCSTQQIMSKYRKSGHSYPTRRLRSVDNVIRELRQAKAQGFTTVHFYDDYLVGPWEYVLELLRRYKDEVALPFFCYLHYSQVQKHPEILEAAVAAGLEHSACGIQHGGDVFARERFGRNIPFDDLVCTANAYIQHGVVYNYDFISDIPIESEADFRSQFDNLTRLPFSANHTRIGISRLKVFPETEIERLCNALPRTDFAEVSWVWKSCLIILRFLMEDSQFREVLDNRYYREHPRTLLNNMPYYWAQHFIRTGESCLLENLTILQHVYEHYAMRFLNKGILVWGTGSRFRQLRYMFTKNTILGFLDNDPARQGSTVDGVEVYGVEALARLPEAPIFICSVWKPAIHAQISAVAPDRLLP